MKDTKIVLIVIGIIVVVGIGIFTFTQNANKPVVETKDTGSAMQNDEIKMQIDPQQETNDTGSLANETMTKDEETTTMAKPENTMMEKDTTSPRYTEYSASSLDASKSSRRVLFFYASWCPTCRPADADFAQNVDKIPGDVTVIRVNYNDPDTDQEEKDLAKKYGITYQHTFVQIDEEGAEITKWNGGQLDELISKIK